MTLVKKNDILFFVILASLMILLGWAASAERQRHLTPSGGELVIERPGQTLRYSLDRDRSFSIGTHTVEISAGRVRVIEARCPLKTCEKQGWVTQGVIICAPNSTAFIVRPAREEYYDVITR